MTERARASSDGGGPSPVRASRHDGSVGPPAPDASEAEAAPTDTWLGLPAAAELAGVHYMTVYRWVRTSRLAAKKSGGTWKVHLSDLQALTEGDRSGASKGAPTGGYRPAGSSIGRLAPMTEALLRGDQGGAWLLIEESRRAGVGPVDVLCGLLEPAMAEIGRRWKAGEVSVAQEHRATVVASRVIGRLSPAVSRPGRNRGAIVVGAIENNRHGLGSAVVADVFRAAGYEANDLGADVPVTDLIDLASDVDNLVAVCLSVAVDGEEAITRRAIAGLRSVTDAQVLVGGTGVPNAAWVTAVGADGWCADGRGAPELVDRLAGSS